MSFFRRYGPGWWIRLFGLALLDGIVVALIPSLVDRGATVALISIVVGTLGINYVFLSARAMPFRWLVPGMVFLVLMMLWPIIFTVWVALTNWSTGNFITKDQAIDRLTQGGAYLIETEEAQVVELYLYRDPALSTPADPLADLKVLVRTEAGDLFYGSPRLRTSATPEEPTLDCCTPAGADEETAARYGAVALTELGAVDDDGDGIPETVGGYAKLRLLDIGTISGVLDQLVLDVPGRGQARARTFSSAVLAEQRFVYDEATDTLYDRLNETTCAAQEGNFVCDGARLDPGWREFQGVENFADIATDERIRTPFLRIFVWNVIFAVSVVLLQLVLGLGLALTFEDRRMKGRGFYRSLLLIPWAAPGFIVILVWRGLLNPTYGPVNNLLEASWLAQLSNSTWPKWLVTVFLVACAAALLWMAAGMLRRRRWFASILGVAGAAVIAWFLYKILGPGFGLREVRIPWVQPTGNWFWSKLAVILVTMWQGFPYFFLICTGALQAIPTDMKEAARVDGASPFQVFWKVTFPLLMVGIAPLIIASFAFNFNAFVNIFLLTAGGPPVSGYGVPFGETDILISFVFDLAVESGRGGQYALAAAATFFIFFIVATISAISFRFTKRLEEIYGSL
ncbi:MAG: ABC transporter permease subunit [Acidimicrobiia bacterium]|nr:ABC transporter permease subunit [Acidimicrobiia bacterium]